MVLHPSPWRRSTWYDFEVASARMRIAGCETSMCFTGIGRVLTCLSIHESPPVMDSYSS